MDFTKLLNPEMELEAEPELDLDMENDPESVLDDPKAPYEMKLEAMQRIKDRYLKPRE